MLCVSSCLPADLTPRPLSLARPVALWEQTADGAGPERGGEEGDHRECSSFQRTYSLPLSGPAPLQEPVGEQRAGPGRGRDGEGEVCAKVMRVNPATY